MQVRVARAEDVPVLLDARRRVELWLEGLGIRQWPVGDVGRDWFEAGVAAGQWVVGVDATGAIAAAAQILDADPQVWPDDPPGQARYVHGFMTNRGVARPGDGGCLLGWIEDRARGEGVPFVRLDCVETNARLRRFYREQGYTEVGRREFPGSWYVAALFEKPLD